MRFELWMTVDCEQCGAAFGEPCVDLGCGDPGCTSLICARRARSLAAGESFHAGGNREAVLNGYDADAPELTGEVRDAAARHAATGCACGACWLCRCAAAVRDRKPSPQDGAQGGPSGAQTRRTRAAPDRRKPTR
jgi:hypothetical protein